MFKGVNAYVLVIGMGLRCEIGVIVLVMGFSVSLSLLVRYCEVFVLLIVDFINVAVSAVVWMFDVSV